MEFVTWELWRCNSSTLYISCLFKKNQSLTSYFADARMKPFGKNNPYINNIQTCWEETDFFGDLVRAGEEPTDPNDALSKIRAHNCINICPTAST